MLKKPKKWLTEQETELLLKSFKRYKPEYYLIFTLCRYGLRIGEILGRGNLPGISLSDVRENGVWMIGKGYSHHGEPPSLYELPGSFVAELRSWIEKQYPKTSRDRKLFSYSVSSAEKTLKAEARRLGIADWRGVSPHRLRAYFATDLKDRGTDSFTIRDMMRHSSINTTNTYVGRATSRRKTSIMNSLTAGARDALPVPR